MAEPTPGPWQVYARGHLTEVQDRNGDPVIFWQGFDRSEIPLARHRANARLIADAPTVLTLLKQFVAVEGGAWHVERYARERQELLDEARALIAKIEGAG